MLLILLRFNENEELGKKEQLICFKLERVDARMVKKRGTAVMGRFQDCQDDNPGWATIRILCKVQCATF